MRKLLMILGLMALIIFILPPVNACAQTTYLTSPTDNSQFTMTAVRNVTLTYGFNGAYPVINYHIQVDDNSTFSSPYVDELPAGTSYTVTGLEAGTRYYWRVQTSYWNGAWVYTSWTSSRSFGFFVPALESPANNALNQSQPLVLEWMAVADPLIFNNGHQIQVDNNADFSSPEIDANTRNSSYSVSGLAYNTKFYWRVNYYYSTIVKPIVTTHYDWSAARSFTTGCDIPAAPALSSPANGASGLSQPINLTWAAIADVDNYAIQIAKNTSFSPTIVSTYTGTATNYEASGLENGTTYYWRVGAHECGWGSYSAYRSFTTACPLPDAPGLVSPANGATGLTLPLSFDWNDVTDATYYKIQIDNDANFSSPVFVETPSSSAFEAASSLLPGVTYYWRVLTHTPCGDGAYSSSRSFTMECPIPNVPSLELPPNGVSDMAQPVNLDWNNIAGATKYHVQVDDNPGFVSLNVENDNVGSSSYAISGLLNWTQYYWRVRSGNSCGWSGWSDVRSFTTDCPVLGPPTLLSPLDDETDLDVRIQVVLDWCDMAGATGYFLQVADNDGFSNPVVDNQPVTSEFTIGYPLQYGTWYYWRVKTNNPCGSGDWSGSLRFQPNCPASGAPDLSVPPNGALSVIQPVALDWGDVAEAEKYQVQVDNNNDFSSMDIDNANIIASGMTLPDLSEGVLYYWRIRTYNGCQWSNWSTTWTFVPGEQSDVELIIQNILPEAYSLRQNYPNPFNPRTTLEFAIPQAEFVTFEVFNVLGEKIETLISKQLSTGFYSIIWDASAVPTGIYFYKIRAGEFSETKKMTLIK